MNNRKEFESIAIEFGADYADYLTNPTGDQKQTILSTKDKPFVLSQDINYLLGDWSLRSGYRIPDPRPYQRELAGTIKSIFPTSEIIGETELQETARETLLRSQKNNGVCISMDRAYMPAVDIKGKAYYLDSSRQIDPDFNSVGLGTRSTTNLDLKSQLRAIQQVVGSRPVSIYDDVAFGGDTMLEILSLAKQAGLKVDTVNLAISTSEAIAKITQAGYNCLVGYEYQTILDEICERDFFVGSPYSGRTIIQDDQTMGAPYISPLGLPVEWASIPERSATEFSKFCLTLALKFWSESERLSGVSIPTKSLAKPPLRLPPNSSVSTAISNILGGNI